MKKVIYDMLSCEENKRKPFSNSFDMLNLIYQELYENLIKSYQDSIIYGSTSYVVTSTPNGGININFSNGLDSE